MRLRKVFVATLAAALVAGVGFTSKASRLFQTPPGSLQLSDKVECFYAAGTRVSAAPSYPEPREIHVDGDVFIRQPASGAPLIVRTRLLVLTARGPAEFRVTARSNETGEQVEVLEGTVEARKAYASPFSEPDRLASGEVSMVNRTIDLMEKEKTDVMALRAWRRALIASIAPPDRR
ncbi:MAG: hypothetical protein WDO68_23510 [Gammaproteobacteria bacterium]